MVPYLNGLMFRFLRPNELELLKIKDDNWLKALDNLENSYLELRKENQKVRHSLLKNHQLDQERLLNSKNWSKYRVASALFFRHRYELNEKLEEEKYFINYI